MDQQRRGSVRPREVAAPVSPAERRLARRQAEAQRRRRQQLKRGLVVTTILGVLLVTVLLWQRRHAAGAVGVPVADEGRGHVTSDTTIPYQHYPPSSGKHFDTPAPAGFSATPIPEGNFVHSLEHGYVVILYKCPTDCAALQQQLRDLPTRFPPSKWGDVKLVIAPYERMASPITALAWDWELRLDRMDQATLRRFYQAHVDHGPEDVP